MRIIGLDLGTVRLGVVVAEAAIPLRVVGEPGTVNVDRYDLDASARGVRVLVDGIVSRGLPPDVVVEFGSLYIPLGATPQKARALAENHATMGRLLALIHQAIPGPFYRVTTIARRTWSARVVPHHSGGVSNAEASAGLATWLDPAGAWPLLSDQHRRDACGAIIGHLLGAPSQSRPGKRGRRRVYILATRTIATRTHDARLDARLPAQQARLAAAPPPLPRYRSPPPRPCGCGPRGPHRSSCPTRAAAT